MRLLCFFPVAILLSLLPLAAPAQTPQSTSAPLPEIRQLMSEVHDHQRQLDKVRENYTYSATVTTEEIDASGQVKKTETEELEEFFVNGHQVGRTVKKNGQPLTGSALDKETEHVTKIVEKAQKTPPDQPLEGQIVSVSRLLEIMDVRNPRRESYRGRPAILFDFVGRKDAQTHGLAEDVSKKLQGTIWIDEADRQIAHLDAVFNDNFHIAGGLVANIQKGSNFHFDQAPVNGELWLPTNAEISLQMRVLLVKGIRQHITTREYDYKRFHVETEQKKDATVVSAK